MRASPPAPAAYLYASGTGESVYVAADFRTEEHLTVMSAPA